MRKCAFIVGNGLLLLVLVLSVIYRRGLVSNPIGQFTGFILNHQHSGWGTSLYYPKIDPLTTVSRDVKVGMIDSGVAKESLDECNIAARFNFSNSNSDFDSIGHGTKIASIIGAKDNHILTIGLSPQSSLYSYKVVDDNGQITNAAIGQAVKQAIADEVDVLNVSMVLKTMTPELNAVISDYINTGGYLVSAAYELNNTDFINPISQISDVISVGSYNEFFNVLKANHENIYYAPYTQEALSLNQHIVRSNGASVSTAFVSGTIANLLSQGKSKQEIRTALSAFFGEQAITDKRDRLLVSYEHHQSSVDYLYTLLGIGTVVVFALYLIVGSVICSQSQQDKQIYLKQLVWNVLFVLVLAYLLLPTQM
ncbi:hypothetical protein CAC02_08190 [Streptococcus gallolyticus]|uniref:Peptidase S8/S53 domain-containing protein n=1 Tax=Streptococcus gallolyticus TaxID=315405 RepID=A0A368UC16_9STRE|nr:S8/S53 family peptidase [Streptococcus gallolyticus]RCW16509.1 hypothetical protein CAC02_08190 [Streptococcus gallolyticus]